MPNDPKTETQGDLFIFAESLLWSFFPIMVLLAGNFLPNLYITGISTLIAFLFFAIVVTWQKSWSELKNKAAWKPMLISTFFIGVLFYITLFWGTSLTTAGNASILSLMEIFFAFLVLGVIWKKEPILPHRVWGAVLMVIGAILVKFSGSWQSNIGDWIVVFATAIPSVGNFYMQEARKLVSASTLMMVRSALSAPVILLLAGFTSPLPNSDQILEALPYLLIIGLFLLGLSKMLWVEGIHRINITKAVTLHTIIPVFTLIWAFFWLNEQPTWWQILGFIPIALGAVLVLRKKVDETNYANSKIHIPHK
jgi:drug/metabolite transporter (DMT)-like permease